MSRPISTAIWRWSSAPRAGLSPLVQRECDYLVANPDARQGQLA